jgi:RNA polymerase sigma factor (sigma-70 family)
MEASAAPRPHGLSASPRLLGLAGDDRLVALIRAGNEAAFEAVYERYHRPLVSFCRHMLGNPDDAAEAVQQAFLSAYRDLTTSEKAIELKPWLFTIARNRCRSTLRARREHANVDLAEPATEGLAADVQRREDLRELLGDIARLPEDQRAALVLAELGSLGHEQIGEVVGCSRAKVKALVFQARSSLATSREARATSCQDVREQLAVLRGGALRRTTLRRHLRDCPGCRTFNDEVRRQRKAFAVILPVAPVAGLKDAVLSGAGATGGAAAATTAGGGAAGVVGALGANSLAVKVLVGAAILGGATAGGVVARGVPGAGSDVAHGSEAVSTGSAHAGGAHMAHTAGADISSVGSRSVAFTRSSNAYLPVAAQWLPANRGSAPANATAGPVPKPGTSDPTPSGQAGSSTPSNPSNAGGLQNGGGSGHGGGGSAKPEKVRPVHPVTPAPKPSPASAPPVQPSPPAHGNPGGKGEDDNGSETDSGPGQGHGHAYGHRAKD